VEDLEVVTGRALIWARLVRAWTEKDRSSSATMAETARIIIQLATSLSDSRAEADAECLLGDGLLALGNLNGAATAFRKCLKISQQLVEQNPSNSGWQRELAVVHGRVGRVLQAQGKLTEAEAAFTK